jgi:hypothetical protein
MRRPTHEDVNPSTTPALEKLFTPSREESMTGLADVA